MNVRHRCTAGALALTPVLFLGASTDSVGDEVHHHEHGTAHAARTWKAEVGKPAPDFELTTTDGKAVQLSSLQGKTVVLEWFNPECPVVVGAHSEGGPLRTMGNEVGSDVVWLAINSGAPGNSGHGAEKNVKACQEWGIDYPVLLDETGWVGRMYNARTTPHMFVIDPKGMLVYDGAIDNGRDKSAAPVNYVAQALADVGGGQYRTQKTKPYGCSVKYAKQATVGIAAPSFTLPSIDGKDVSIADFRGHVTVLEWFNPDCPVVKKAHKAGATLDGAAARWADKGVAWVAINSGAPGKQGHGVETNKSGIERWGLQHPVLMDEEGKVGKAFGARTTPHMFILDQRGVLVYAGGHDDRSGKSYVDQALTEILAGRQVSEAQTQSYGCSVKY